MIGHINKDASIAEPGVAAEHSGFAIDLGETEVYNDSQDMDFKRY